MAKPGTPSEILDMALRKEQSAYRFYDRMARSSAGTIMLDLLEKLREEEGRHVQLIERKLAALRLGRSVS